LIARTDQTRLVRGGDSLSAVMHTELHKDPGDVSLHRCHAEHEVLGNIFVGEAQRDQSKDFALSSG
jgi:hypothetical protein